MAAGIQGNDDSFVAFSFAIVSLVMIALYFPVFTGMIRDTYAFFFASDASKKRRRGAEEDEVPPKKSWRILWDDFAELPLTVVSALKYPGQVMAGARLLWANRGLGYSVFFWDCVRFCVRPRFIVLWLWIFLMSSAMYATMTFDPYGALGLTSSATDAEIKQAYRKLSKLNHPDVNKTEAAKAIYPTIKKAYKALVDRDAFEKDAENEEMSFGIGLPSWMTSHEHDGKILFALLGLLIAIPAAIWHHFRGNSLDKLKAIVGRVTSMSKQLEPLYLQLGIPLDPKFVERRRERRELTEILVNMGLLPIAEEALVDGFPHLTEFKRMCLQPEKNTVPLAKLGLDVSTHPALKNFFESYELEEPLKLPEGTFQRADSITYEAVVYIIRKTQAAIEKDLQEMIRVLQMLTNRVPEFRVVKKLERHHEELLETLALVYRGDSKPQARDIKILIEVPQRREELVRDIPKEIQGYFVALQQQQQQHQQMMMQQMMQQQRRR